MRVAIACDHAGYPLKELVIKTTLNAGHEVIDLGTHDTQCVDYPDFAEKLGMAILSGEASRGILLCGSGVGASITANKIHGIYAGLCHDSYSAGQGVEHDDMNVLCLGARVIGQEIARTCVNAFLAAQFSEEERHHRRVRKMRVIEEKY